MISKNPLQEVHKFGQSIWMDFINRNLLVSGKLEKLIREDDVRGMTSNPSIFGKAISEGEDYRASIEALAYQGMKPAQIYERLVVDDIRQAADLFRPLYDETNGGDGFVSIEVNPHFARKTRESIEEAHRLWNEIDRPNIMVKIPGTKEGLPAIRQLTADGMNINITLLFGLDRYREVVEAYLSGLEDRQKAGKPLKNIASVASFFLSRIDVLVDPMLEEKMKGEDEKAKLAQRMRGQVAIASARIAYQIYKEIFSSDRFSRLQKDGAAVQRLLWGSTSTKNPDYSDVKYVEALIGPDTVNTIPMETLEAFRDHGKAVPLLETDIELSRQILSNLARLDIDLKQVTEQLVDEGIEKFNKPYDKLMETLSRQVQKTSSGELDMQKMNLGTYEPLVSKTVNELESGDFVRRMWEKDGSLWKKDSDEQKMIKNAMGWMHLPEKMIDAVQELEQFSAEVKEAGFTHVVHMGMGGSSLAPFVFQVCVPGEGGLPLTVLDSTDPAAIINVERNHPLETTLFIVATKSGSTVEALVFTDYFYSKLEEKRGAAAGENFVAITDPGSPLTGYAKGKKFRRTFLNFSDIGGRYSALSYFGLVPAALKGVKTDELLERAMRMLRACYPSAPADGNPAVELGAAIGALAKEGRDKLTFVLPDNLAALGMWLEQLLAESTGKEDTGILPVAGEALLDPDSYDDDRVFVHIHLKDEKDEKTTRKLDKLQEEGHPVISITMGDTYDIGQEFVRWEFATAVAGAVLGINPFDQPNVQESKDNTKQLLKEVADKGRLPEKTPAATSTLLNYYADWFKDTGDNVVRMFLGKARPHDYIAIQAFLTESEETTTLLQDIRTELQRYLKTAVTVGFGPRFLHSTGQFHKGGTNSGLFLQLTMDEPVDRAIPGRTYGYKTLHQAQAMGDFDALVRHDRRILRVDLGDNVTNGLKALHEQIREASEKMEDRKHVAK